jgi:hyperosmotically inducible periplasmic protein
MSISRWIVSLSLGLVVIGAACTEKETDQSRKAVQDVKDKTKEVAEDAVEKSKEVAADAADKGKKIVSKTGEVITDGWITTKVKAKFADEKLLKDSNLSVETKDRVVTLSGTATTSDAKNRAVMIANGTEGVLRVTDNIAVAKK